MQSLFYLRIDNPYQDDMGKLKYQNNPRDTGTRLHF